nr:hypothetical protein [Clostridia bacterium]
MNKIKKGDIVGRISYGKDIYFIVDRVIKIKKNTQVAILKGLTIRIKADSLTEDLELIDKKMIKNTMNDLENRISERLSKYSKRVRKKFKFGKILHLDGDSRYTQKSIKYYREIGMNAVVRNVPESRQPFVVKNLLERYKPDVLVITRT